MNIKDIETRSGMTRANIRFYEQEDLLHPQLPAQPWAPGCRHPQTVGEQMSE